MIINTMYEIGDYVRVEGYGDGIYNIIAIYVEAGIDGYGEIDYDVSYFVENLIDKQDGLEAYEEDIVRDVTDDMLEEYLSREVLGTPKLTIYFEESKESDFIQHHQPPSYAETTKLGVKKVTKQELIDEQLTIIADYLGLIEMFGEDEAYREAIKEAEQEINRISKEG